MTVYASTALIAGLGVAVLTGLTFGPTAQSRQIAVVIPPWQMDGLDRIAATGLPILDLHWHHHIIVLETGGDPAALARLQSQGLWLLDATGAGICGPVFKGT
jgi:hypothetical protein